MSDESQKDDPVATCILDVLNDKGSAAPQQIAQIFFNARKTPQQPADGWRKFLPAVRQQAIHLARQGRIEITRKGKVVDPNDFKGIIRLRLPQP